MLMNEANVSVFGVARSYLYKIVIFKMCVSGAVQFAINIFDGSGDFELMEGGSVTVSGRVRLAEGVEREQLSLPPPTVNKADLLDLGKADIYKDLRLRGYDYRGVFCGILQADNKGKLALLLSCVFVTFPLLVKPIN